MDKTFTFRSTKKQFFLTIISLFLLARVSAQAPVVSSFSPASGAVGTIVTITGSGFNPAAINNIVFFGATMATVTAASANSLTVTVPVGATYQPISVLNGSSALVGYSAKPFLTTFTPSKGAITAADFNPRVTITTNGWCQGIVIADLDGDGKPDLAMADLWNHTLSIFQNTSVSGSITASSFGPKVTFATGNAPEGIAAGDLDGDGKPDLVVTNATDNTISIFRNTSTIGTINSSSFSPGVTLATLADPEFVAITDLDGDGKPDLIVSGFSANGISVFKNTSVKGSLTASSFAAHVDFAADSITSMAAGDLDGDGKVDLVATNYQSHKVYVWRNTSTTGSIGVSSFAPPVSFATGINPGGVAIGDLDGDGKPDLVVTSGTDTVSVLRNTSTIGSITAGSFAARVDFITASLPRNIAISDLDGDGKPDIAVTGYGAVSILRNTSTPGSITASSFAAKVDFFIGPYSYYIAIGDLDGDGKPDIAVPNSNNSVDANTVSILHNNPFFTPSVQATDVTFSNTGTNSTTVSWTNGNGLSRAVFIAAATLGNASPVNGITYAAGSVLGAGTQIGSSGWYCVYNDIGTTVNLTGLSSGITYRVMVAEYDGTAGAENYLSAASIGNPANVNTLPGGPITIDSISMLGSSPPNAATVQYTVTFASAVTGLTASNFSFTTTGSAAGAAITSVSGSGMVYTVTVNTGTGTGTLALNLANAAGLTPGIISALPFAGPAFAVDHSVHPAPVIYSFSPSNGPEGTSVTITGTGFAPAAANDIVFFGAAMAPVTAASATSLTVTVPTGATYRPITVLNGNTALMGYSEKPFLTTFTPNKGAITTEDFLPPVDFLTGNGCNGMAIGDLDGDGKPDLVIANSGDNTISVLRNISVKGVIAANSFAPKVDFATGSGPFSLAIGDLDGDGKPDIAVTNSNDNTISIFRNTSTAGAITASSFAPKVTLATDSGAYNIVIGDLDGDGKADIVVATATESISILRNISTGGTLAANSFAAGVNFKASTWTDDYKNIAIGDLDGDGKPEIAVTTYQSSDVAVFHNTSTIGSITASSFAAPVYFPTNFLPMSVAIGDLDGDGKPDLAVGSGVISILRNTSVYGSITSSSFAPRVDFLGLGGNHIAISDLDGDGKPDIAAVSWYSGSKTVSVFRNTSTIGSINSASLATMVNFDVGASPYDVAIADLDGDGKPDIATTLLAAGAGNMVAVLRNNPFFPPTVQATNVVFSATGANSTTASWTNGNGAARAVFICAASAGSPLPVNRTTYSANPVYAAGTQIASSGWYCIYNGTGNAVNISGLSSGATYRVMVLEYNGNGGGENYLTTLATGNPADVTTVAGGAITINSINLVTPALTNSSSVQYTATFATAVTGLTASDFALATTGAISGASVASLSGSGSTYTITVNTGTGDGTIGLNLAGAAGLTPGIITSLPFAGQSYTIDRTPPAITISNPSDSTVLSGTKPVSYTVTYSDVNFSASTLSAPNITLNRTGSATGTVSVSGSDTSYTVTISNITGSGAIGISIAAGTATDLAGNSAAASNPSASFLVSPVLTNLAISSGTLSPVFADTLMYYSASVTNNVSALTVTPTATDPNVNVTVNGGSASTPVNLVPGPNTITVNATTLNGKSTTIYTISVLRFGLPPNIAYGTGKITLSSAQPFSITPTNSGGAVPATVYAQVSTFAGSTAAASGYADGTGTAAQFNFPQQMTRDAPGNLYVADANNNVIRKITPAGVVSTFAGSITGLAGFTNATGTSALFNYPDGIAIDGSGNLLVSDYYNNAIRKITPGGVVSTVYSSPGSFGPGGLCFDASGNLIVAGQDVSQIIKISPAGLASIVAGSSIGYSNGPALTAQFDVPTDVKVDSAGNIYIADFQNNAIRKISTAGVVSTIAGSAVYGNTPGYANGPGTTALFNNPSGIMLAAGGVIYVADMLNNEIRRIMPDTTVSLVAGSASQAPGNSDGTGTAAGFTQPDYLYLDIGTGTGYIAELGGNRIRKIVLTGYTLKGALPPGLAFDPTTGMISGTPLVPFLAKTDTVTAFNAFGYSTKIITLSYKPLSAIATLMNLVPSAGALSPAFASPTTSYTDAVSYASAAISLTPTTTDSTATLTVNGAAVLSGNASAMVPLSVGANTITTVVTAQDGSTTDTYIVTVNRAAASILATLNNLAISSGTLTPVFASGTLSYSAGVPNATTSITVTPTAGDVNATVTVNGTSVTSGAASGNLPLVVGPNTITTVITAQDGTTMETYTIVVTRAPSSVATLANLSISQGTLTPAFDPAISAYVASVPNNVAAITETPTFTDPNSTITVNGTAVVSGTASANIPLAVGPNTITTVVTAEDGTTKVTYTVTLTKAGSSDAALINLTVSQGSLSPAFTSATTAYTDSVSNLVTSITVTPTTSDNTATVTVNGTTVASGTASEALPLVAGENTITVVVSAQDGVSTETYTITVYRGESIADISTTNILTPNGDGKNDYWLVKDIALYPQNTVTIFDKAGRVVYSKHGYNNEWDGTSNGSPLAEGTYYFVVDLGPNLRKFKGFISILRN